MPTKRTIVILVVAVGCLAAQLWLDHVQPFAYARLRNLYRDAITRSGRQTPANPNLVFLAIDSDSVGLEQGEDVTSLYGLTPGAGKEERALSLMSKLWPWSREVYGLILDRLVAAGAKVVIFDLTFPTPSDNDGAFAASLERNRDHVVLGSNFVSSSSRGFATVGASHTRPPETLIPRTSPMDERVAFTNFWPDDDDVVRRAQYTVTFEQVQGRLPEPESERFLSLGARAMVKAGLGEFVPKSLDDFAFRYTAPARVGFPPHSVFEIFVPDYWKNNYKSGEFFRDKIVLVGAEGNWQHDEHPTPFGSMPGPEVHLNAMNAALHREFIREPPQALRLGSSILAALVAIALCAFVRSPWLRPAYLLGFDLALVGLAVLSYNRGVFLPLVGTGLVLNSIVIFGLISDFAGERVERKRLRRTLERYVSHDVVRELLDKPKLYANALGGVVKPVSILFSDIRGYSIVSARTDPQALVSQLNEYLTAMVECVFATGGTLDKFIGDAVMAVWGNTRSAGVREDARNAVRAAIAMRAALVRLNESWRERGLPELRAGTAINHGRVVVGNIGSPQRMEFTVVGDAVNTSWRLQELTKVYGFDLLVGENVAKLVIEDFDLRPLGSTTIRDSGDMEVFAVIGDIQPVEEIQEAVPSRHARN